ncbi:hypothetical protein R70006_04887 [Paraburkholderia domus]|uniref:class I SAM-dependent methyltransferase n=1 Tax=Paraburkholderia domus TaxID=2793075 RepID=UPI001914B484|nr:class I SAM-dependent methyltransferase [Paraburkholderia domus]MBK5051590.1 SAM-dependent DNA methyltransferase [Burkholderia sp. R-70006]CAE6791791.1 hypothetical protein R70006_04887 [Paraburkholderia domus]CAE6795790.1 hypothetical protein R75483_05109 [Paraburkholderia domus]
MTRIAPDIECSVRTFTVAFDAKPFDIFELRTRGERLVGVKAEVCCDPMQPDERRKCCLIDAPMIRGRIAGTRVTADGVTVYYRPVSVAFASELVENAVHDPDASLSYPFARIVSPGVEPVSSDADWNPAPEFCAALDRDEIHFRAASVNTLRELGWHSGVAYDPACSTGAFLAHVKAHFPATHTIGQDRNAGMAALARTRLDEVHVGDSITPARMPRTVDLLVLRHLNVDVVTFAQAATLFDSASETLRAGGICLVFGHTPVQLPAAFFEMRGYDVLSRLAATPSRDALFEYYVLRKRSGAR